MYVYNYTTRSPRGLLTGPHDLTACQGPLVQTCGLDEFHQLGHFMCFQCEKNIVNAAKSFHLGSNALIAGNDDLVQTHGLRSNDDFVSTVKCIQILCGEDMLETCGQESFLRNIQTFQQWKNKKKLQYSRISWLIHYNFLVTQHIFKHANQWYSMAMSLRSLSFEMGSTVFCFGSSSPASEMSGQRMYYQHLSTTKWQTWNENEGQKIASHTTQIKMQRALLCCHVQITGEQAKIEPYTPKISKTKKVHRYPSTITWP